MFAMTMRCTQPRFFPVLDIMIPRIRRKIRENSQAGDFPFLGKVDGIKVDWIPLAQECCSKALGCPYGVLPTRQAGYILSPPLINCKDGSKLGLNLASN